MDVFHDRRAFLRAAASASVAWAAADLAEVDAALDWAADRAAAGQVASFTVLTAAQAAVIDAMSSRILPAVDGRLGAHEAGVVLFVDRALATFNAGSQRLYASGIADLNRRAARAWKVIGFTSLSPDRQDAVLRVVERTPFFQAVRVDTIAGTFSQPSWGGNREHAGWRLLGFDHQPAFQPPFGYYDANLNRLS